MQRQRVLSGVLNKTFVEKSGKILDCGALKLSTVDLYEKILLTIARLVQQRKCIKLLFLILPVNIIVLLPF